MELALLNVSLLLLCFGRSIQANRPRMTFTDKDTSIKRFQYEPVRILVEAEMDTVTAVGRTSLISFNFQNPATTPVEKEVLISKNQDKGCNYNITMVHRAEEADQLFLCGAVCEETFCCYVNVSDQAPKCMSSHKAKSIESSIGQFSIMEGELSALVESGENADLYVTYSGSQEPVGIHKFGKDSVRPANHNKEQYYVGLIPIRHHDDALQGKVYAFYKEKNKDTRLDGEMWLPFVTRVCMADLGGPKNNLQFSWTSQMNARLFCGDPDRRQHFSELVDVATVQAGGWNKTRVYALFRNEWGMSAVCVYTMQDIENIFATSPLKGNSGSHKNRARMCVSDSRKIPLADLRIIEENSEMEKWVRPENNSAPLLLNNHNYTRIYADSSDHTVLFLSGYKGGIHKVMYSTGHNIVISEYQPFNHQAHVTSIALDPPSRKLYVSTGSEVVQLDVVHCTKYGDSCEDCILARDPYCGWNGTHCAPKTRNWLQDVTGGNHSICTHSLETAFLYSQKIHADKDEDIIMVPAESKYYLICPVSSHHAHYTWHHGVNSTYCHSKMDQCLFLISSMGDEHEGTYSCESEERGFRKVLAKYKLQIKNRAVGPLSSPVVWLSLMYVLTRSL